jgi:sucrose-6F-phosphate phosphohydrolase
MESSNKPTTQTNRILATDMDGTLLPLRKSAAEMEALSELNKSLEGPATPEFVIVTGRRFETVMEAYEEFPLPPPDWIICDVGSSIYHREGNEWVLFREYADELAGLVGTWDHEKIFNFVENMSDIRPQDAVHQQAFKASFNTPEALVENVANTLATRFAENDAPLNVIFNHDLETGEGMIDVLPKNVSKAYALKWLIKKGIFAADQVVFAGDSGNDLDVFLSGLRSIIVSNAPAWIHRQAHDKAASAGDADRIYSAQSEATCGLVEGLRHFGWIAK